MCVPLALLSEVRLVEYYHQMTAGDLSYHQTLETHTQRISLTTVEPPNKGHYGGGFVPCREVVLISEVK